jgi:hypothetical protein
MFPSQPFDCSPGKRRKDKIMIVQDILRNGYREEGIEGFDRRYILP